MRTLLVLLGLAALFAATGGAVAEVNIGSDSICVDTGPCVVGLGDYQLLDCRLAGDHLADCHVHLF